jgi:hypothetical protein
MSEAQGRSLINSRYRVSSELSLVVGNRMVI